MNEARLLPHFLRGTACRLSGYQARPTVGADLGPASQPAILAGLLPGTQRAQENLMVKPTLSALILALGCSSTAAAYVVATDQNGHVEHWVTPAVTFRAPATFPGPLTAGAARAVISSAAQSWTQASGLQLSVEGDSSGGPGYDPN